MTTRETDLARGPRNLPEMVHELPVITLLELFGLPYRGRIAENHTRTLTLRVREPTGFILDRNITGRFRDSDYQAGTTLSSLVIKQNLFHLHAGSGDAQMGTDGAVDVRDSILSILNAEYLRRGASPTPITRTPPSVFANAAICSQKSCSWRRFSLPLVTSRAAFLPMALAPLCDFVEAVALVRQDGAAECSNGRLKTFPRACFTASG